MSALLWQSWPRITFKESQRIFKYFSSQDEVIHFRSSRKQHVGLLGQGIVVFRNEETAKKLMEKAKQESLGGLDLSHLFDPPTSAESDPSPVSDAVQASSESTEASSRKESRDWRVTLKNPRSPSTSWAYLEATMVRRQLSVFDPPFLSILRKAAKIPEPVELDSASIASEAASESPLDVTSDSPHTSSEAKSEADVESDAEFLHAERPEPRGSSDLDHEASSSSRMKENTSSTDSSIQSESETNSTSSSPSSSRSDSTAPQSGPKNTLSNRPTETKFLLQYLDRLDSMQEFSPAAKDLISSLFARKAVEWREVEKMTRRDMYASKR